MNQFKQIIVIGYGVIVGEILDYICRRSEDFGYSTVYIEHEVYPFSIAANIAHTRGAVYLRIEDKSTLTTYFANNIFQKTLIISAGNNYIFPPSLVSNKDVTIVNFHNALLPDYPGRNAPSWVIFDGIQKTGITWHYVTEEIDRGNIIVQKEFYIPEDIKAYILSSHLMKLAYEAFINIFESILLEQVETKPQGEIKSRRLYRSTDIPGSGKFHLSDDPQYIYRLLRSMDYGKNGVFPQPIMEYEGKQLTVKKYKIVDTNTEQCGEETVFISMDGDKQLQLRVANSELLK